MSEIIRVLLADKYPLIQAGVRAILSAEKDLMLVGEATNNHTTIQLIQECKPDVLLLGRLDVATSETPEQVSYLRKLCLKTRVLVLDIPGQVSILDIPDRVSVHDLVKAGIAGCVFIYEDTKILIHAIRTVAQGHTWFSQIIVDELVQDKSHELSGTEEATLTSTLTIREQQVLGLIAQGWDNWKIASKLGLAEQTIRNYVSRIYNKLALGSRAEAILWCKEQNFFSREINNLI